MSNIALNGSLINSPFGKITQGHSFCKVNGTGVTYVGATGTTHESHLTGAWTIKIVPGFFKVDGKCVPVVGSKTTCGHVITTGGFVRVGGAL
tara:strand:- start:1099 stop:1374 length:276 start_codon:yes stop_codon:yes gene_type:complete